jgi:hypothetical protein
MTERGRIYAHPWGVVILESVGLSKSTIVISCFDRLYIYLSEFRYEEMYNKKNFKRNNRKRNKLNKVAGDFIGSLMVILE